MRKTNSENLVPERSTQTNRKLSIIIFILCLNCLSYGCSASYNIVSLFGENGTVEYNVPTRTKILSVNYSQFKLIYGLENLSGLNTLKINFTNTFSDYQFLKKLSIKRIVLTNAHIENLRFITETPSLELVYIESCVINELEPIDVSEHPRLRLLDIEKCKIAEFPLSGHLPRTLEYVWLMRNNISTLKPEMIMQLEMLRSVAFKHNPISVDTSPNMLPHRFTQDRPPNDKLPTDLKRFFSDWWASDYTIQGNMRP